MKNISLLSGLSIGASFTYFFYQAVLYIQGNSVNLLFWDQWDIVRLITKESNPLALFLATGNEHRLGTGILFVVKPLAMITRWNTRAEVAATLGILLVSAILAFVIKRRISGGFSFSDAIIPLLFFNLHQGDNLLNGFQVLFVLPLLFLMLALVLFGYKQSRKRDTVLLLIAVLSANSHFHGLFLTGMAIGFYWLEYVNGTITKRKLITFAGVYAVVIGMYFVGFPAGRFESVQRDPLPMFRYIEFVSAEINYFFGITTAGLHQFIIPSAIIAIAGWVIMKFIKKPSIHLFVIICLFVYSILFSFSTALGRAVDYTLTPAQQTRYVTHLIPLYMGAYIALERMVSARRAILRVSLVFIVFVLYTAHLSDVSSYATYHRLGREKWRSCYQRIRSVEQCNKTASYLLFPEEMSPYVEEQLALLEQRRWNVFAE